MPETFSEYARSPHLTEDERVLVKVLRDYAIANHRNLERATSLILEPESPEIVIRTLDALRFLPQIRELHVVEHAIADLTPLQSCPHLERLDLANNQVQSLAPLAHCTKLKWLGIKDNPVTDFSPLRQLPALRNLFIDGQPEVDLQSLDGLTSLEWLDMGHLTSFEALPSLPNLQKLHCVRLGSWAGIGRFPSLQSFVCISLEEQDLVLLRDARQLTELSIFTSRVTSLEPLAGLKSLRKLAVLTKAPTLDLLPLRQLPALRKVDILCQNEPVPGLEELKKKKKGT